MKTKLLVLIITLSICFIECSKKEAPVAPPPQKVGELDGHVTYAYWVDTLYHQGAIVGAQVCLINQDCQYTDQRGWYVMENVPFGRYQVYAHADGYSYFQGTVLIDDEGLTSYHIKLDKVE